MSDNAKQEDLLSELVMPVIDDLFSKLSEQHGVRGLVLLYDFEGLNDNERYVASVDKGGQMARYYLIRSKCISMESEMPYCGPEEDSDDSED